MTTPDIRCILVNYQSPWEMLSACLESLYPGEENGPGASCTVTLVDNGSGDEAILERVLNDFPHVGILRMPENRGFAAAVNEGLRTASEPFVLLLNTDAVLAPGALARLREALAASPSHVAAVAPKMMSSAHEGVIDAVGTVMPPTGAGFNRGIGQCDLGQYDQPEEVAGVCFGAALLRRELFEPDSVGPLYEGYFLYFEDSDWCLRAWSQGYRFVTVPDSIVYHMHSGVARKESLPFKYRLIELNTLRIVVRNFESRWRVLRIVGARTARLVARTVIRRAFIRANISALSAFAAELPRLLRERRKLRANRRVSDRGIFRMAAGEDAFFDTVDYRPQHTVDSLIATYDKLLRQRREPRYGKLLAVLYRLKMAQTSGEPLKLTASDRELFDGEPECVRALLAMATAQAPSGLSESKP